MKIAAATEVRYFGGSVAGLHEIDRAQAITAIRQACDEAGGLPADGYVWIDIVHPTEVEASFLRDELGMHPLAVEDCLRGRQRPKLDQYPGYSFVVFYASRINPARARMALNEIHLFLGKSFIISVHDQAIPEVEHVLDGCRTSPARWSQAAAVAYALLDVMTDNYFPLVEHFSERIEGYEEDVFVESPTVSMERIAHLRRELISFRRVLGPQRDVLSLLIRRDLPNVPPELIPYFGDVHDHILRATEEVDTLRDLLAGLIEMHASMTGKQLNQTMRTLTAWSIILMTVTLVAGIYGMNFDYMPELRFVWGYFGALVLMLGIGAALLGYFHSRRWL